MAGVVLVAGVALPLLLLLFWLFASQVQREEREARELALRIARSTALRLQVENVDGDRLLQRLAERPAFRQFDATTCESLWSAWRNRRAAGFTAQATTASSD